LTENVKLLSIDHVPENIDIREVLGVVYAARPVTMGLTAIEEEIEALLDKLKHKAASKGANMVIGLRIDVQRVVGAGVEWALLLVYGTAVKAESKKT
jgi:uncharacterized protein YbjQ (UPF0145 family)